MPPEVVAALVALLASEVSGIEVIGGPIAPPDGVEETPPPRPERRPASREEVMRYALHRPPLKIGDTVRWREGMRTADWPAYGQHVVVSQTIDPPLYALGRLGHSEGAERHDIAVGFIQTASNEDGEDQGPIMVEFLYDSRRFEVV